MNTAEVGWRGFWKLWGGWWLYDNGCAVAVFLWLVLVLVLVLIALKVIGLGLKIEDCATNPLQPPAPHLRERRKSILGGSHTAVLAVRLPQTNTERLKLLVRNFLELINCAFNEWVLDELG